MTEVVSLKYSAATAALQVVLELIKAGDLKTGGRGSEAATIIATHRQLTEHFLKTQKPNSDG
ncbi:MULTISPECIES: hypothetical protein [Pseudomonas]|uniref:Uncharacterized protein n=1 Tax=Pseudomonas juntendi TaxID=2666183 RepID=A0A7W2JH85_9PSED|nr:MULTISPECIES: hypothetical protein [Pseudomonas]MBA6058959.1 hypothetical protein [Pseudomonas juntendi]MBA6126063.1 hypothetical protein [Pseudomonas juntendi]MCL8306400.1 hypothetical protein [Pseudomonas putida]